MKTVHKFDLSFDSDQFVRAPKGARPLSVLNQFERLVLYALIDSEVTVFEDLVVRVKCTGNAVEFHGERFLGTAAFRSGEFIVHVWCSR